jgi:hypothetical protein
MQGREFGGEAAAIYMNEGIVLLRLPHVVTILQNRLPRLGGLTEGFFPSCSCLTRVNCLPLQVARHLSRSQDSILPSHLPSVYRIIVIYRHLPHKGARTGLSPTLLFNAFTHKTTATGDLLRPNHIHSVPLDCVSSPIKQML